MSAVGIYLGSVYSCVGVYREGRVNIIENNLGCRTTPCWVAFNDDEVLVGECAKSQSAVNSQNTIFGFWKLVGARFSDDDVQKHIRQLPFEVFNDKGSPKIRVQFRMKEKVVTPEEISAMILSEMKKIAERWVGHEVRDAVITVPAYFNDSQRQATIDAGKIAGLNVLSIINEPTAAALAYGFDKREGLTQTVLVYDFGSGTFDVAILSIKEKIIEVKVVGEEANLGGDDMDHRLLEYLLALIKRKYGKDISCDKRAMGRLKKACEETKNKLTRCDKTLISIECLFDGHDFSAPVTRGKFEDLCKDLFERTLQHVERVLDKAHLNKDDIDEVILVGGSSRIPKVQQLLKSFFNGKTMNLSVDPNEAMTHGAALWAAQLVSKRSEQREKDLALNEPCSSVLISSGARTSAVKNNSIGDKITQFEKNPLMGTKQATARPPDYEAETNDTNKFFLSKEARFKLQQVLEKKLKPWMHLGLGKEKLEQGNFQEKPWMDVRQTELGGETKNVQTEKSEPNYTASTIGTSSIEANTSSTTLTGRVAIGIDLGTTSSCVGILRNGKMDIIENRTGSRTTPSWVAFEEEEMLVGESAKKRASVDPGNTLFEIKRLIGRRFNDDTVQNDMRRWPFVVFNGDGHPKIRVQYKGEEHIITAEEVTAKVLSEMKKIAEKRVGHEVCDAVITVPAYFNDSQRQATIDAGKIAGLNVLSILNEPTAAALAYGFDNKGTQNRNILIYDLGGGTFDVVIITIVDRNFQVRAVGGDTHLGGGDFDSRLMEHFIEVIKRRYGEDIRNSKKAIGRLRKACEQTKVALSAERNNSIVIDCLFNGTDVDEKISRLKFEELCMDLFEKTIELMEGVLKDAKMDKSDIDEIVLVGGSSRIPKIRELIREFFGGKSLNESINPDEAVAYGAALRAATLISDDTLVRDITLQDVVPLSLGMAGEGDVLKTFIERNTRIPVTVRQDNWTTSEDYQESVDVSVYEGENQLASKNNLLGNFVLYLGERVEKEVPRLTFTFTVDENGILQVSGENTRTKCKDNIRITYNKGRLSSDAIERMANKSKLVFDL